MSSPGTRLQLFGIALVLAGGFYGLQKAVKGHAKLDLSASIVALGLVAVLAGLLSSVVGTNGS